jgi:hypothetical protein
MGLAEGHAQAAALCGIGETEIKVRPATDDEHETWGEALDDETGEGKQIDPSMGGDRDALNVYLIPTCAVEGEDEETE